MKTFILATAISLAAAGASAHDLYRGLAEGSPDLQEPHGDGPVAVQPGVGDSTSFYSRTGVDKSGLFQGGRSGAPEGRSSSWAQGIYGGLCGGNQDLNC